MGTEECLGRARESPGLEMGQGGARLAKLMVHGVLGLGFWDWKRKRAPELVVSGLIIGEREKR